MIRINKMVIISTCVAAMAAGNLFAATLEVGSPSVVVTAGQTVEIPLSSTLPIASNLTARGTFQQGDVKFTPGPGCRLTAHSCTLLITAAPTSKSYTAVPVMVSEAAASNRPIFALSVIQPGESVPANMELPKNDLALLMLSKQLDNEEAVAATKTMQHPAHPPHTIPALLQRSGNSLFYGIAEPHPGLLSMAKESGHHFTQDTNGPAYQIVALTNHDTTQPLSVAITGVGASSFEIDNKTSHYGKNHNCAAMPSIATGDSCLVIIKSKIGNPNQAPQTAALTVRGNGNNMATFTLTSTTYVYAAGGFDALGNASVTGGDLLAQCTAGTCSNALQGTTGDNFASTNSGTSVGQWINALAITPAGNLIVGGVFGAIGGATSGVSSGGPAALLAQCTPGSVAGNACINQINTGSTSNPYVFNSAYIDGIALNTDTRFIYLGGDFANIRNTSVSAGQKMLAKCSYNGESSNSACSNYLSASKSADNAISAINTLGATSGTPVVNTGGLFTQIAGYPTSAPSSGTTFASCTSSACSKGMGSNNPNNSILGITDDGTYLYMGGVFTQIGGYMDSNSGYPLVTCTLGATTTCSNALSENNDANGYIEGLAYSGGNLYVGGKFTTIGGATQVSAGNMLAVCTVDSNCSNFVTDTNPYATGSDWGGNISAIAVGTQTSIAAN